MHAASIRLWEDSKFARKKLLAAQLHFKQWQRERSCRTPGSPPGIRVFLEEACVRSRVDKIAPTPRQNKSCLLRCRLHNTC